MPDVCFTFFSSFVDSFVFVPSSLEPLVSLYVEPFSVCDVNHLVYSG